MKFNKIFENWSKNVLTLDESIQKGISSVAKDIEQAKQEVFQQHIAKIISNDSTDPGAGKEIQKMLGNFDALYSKSDTSDKEDLFDSLMNSLEKKGYKYLGQGSFRTVYSIPYDENGIVVKFANPVYDKKARLQNAKETSLGTETRYGDLFPKTYGSDDNNFWMLSEFVRPIKTGSEFNKMVIPELYSAMADYDMEDPFVESVYIATMVYVDNYMKYGRINVDLAQDAAGTNFHKRFAFFYDKLVKSGVWKCGPMPGSQPHHGMHDKISTYIDKLSSDDMYMKYQATDEEKDCMEYFEDYLKHCAAAVKKNRFLSSLMQSSMEHGVEVWDVRPGNVGVNGDGEIRLLDASVDLSTKQDTSSAGSEGATVKPGVNESLAQQSTSWENDFSGAMKRFIYNNNQ